MPQLQQQYQNSNSQLGFKLGRQGLLNSSAADQAHNALSSAMTQSQDQIANQAVGQANQQRQQVAQQKANLIGYAQNATNPMSMQQQAMMTAGSMQAPSTFAPIGQMLGQFGSMYLGGQQGQMFNNAVSQMGNSTMNNSANFGFSLPKNNY
jgi:hypothetical protein